MGALTIGTTYKLTYTISNYSEGNIVIQAGWQSSGTSRSANGTYTEYLVCAGDTKVAFLGTSSFTGSIDNVSVREVGQDWDLIGTATITENQANIVTASAVTGISQSNILTIGKSYKLSYNIVSNNNGGLKISGNEIPSVVGNNIYYFEASAVSLEILRNSGITDISITNISVKEVGQNWEFGDGWSVGSGLASKSSGTASNLFQSNVLVVGLAYKVTFTLSNYSNGNVTPYCGGTGAGTSRASNGTFTEIIIALTSTTFFLVANSTFTGSVTNISVIEITDETNLPRINYEGFSYQDALGSELITGGDFSNPSDWNLSGINLSISNGKGISTGSNFGAQFKQTILTINKTYKLVFDIVDYTSGAIGLTANYYGTQQTFNSVGTHTAYFTSLNQTELRLYSENFIGSIDNVSVKEYLGQSVVPGSGCGSWLFEPQSTNLITYSEDFSDAYWAKSGSPIVTLNYGISPSGKNNSVRIQGNNSTAIYHSGGFSATDGRSIYVKSTSGSGNIQLLTHNGNTDNVFSIDENWQRVEINTSSSNPALFYAVDMRGSSTNIYDIEIWGAQLEVGNISSYIPTSGSTVTRNQDVCTNGGSLASINSTEGTLYAEIAALANDGTNRAISINNGGLSDYLFFRYRTNNQFQIIFKGK